MRSHTRPRPLLTKCCLHLSANESFLDAEKDIEALTGVKVGHTTQQRLVQCQTFELPDAKQTVTKVSVDGVKVRLRGVKAGESPWWRPF